MLLQDYIIMNHDGSVAAFAKAEKLNRASVYRWLEADAVWFNNNVYINTTKRPE